MSVSFAAIGLAIAALFVVAPYLGRSTDAHPQQPPTIPSRIPYVGHVIGILWNGKDYYRMLDEKYGLDMYRLPIPGVNYYVIASPSLAAAAGRFPKSISFRPIAAASAKHIAGLPADTDAINHKNLMDEHSQGVYGAMHDLLYGALPAGPGLDEISRELLAGIADNVNNLRLGAHDDLLDLCKMAVGTSTLRALYGPGLASATAAAALVRDFWRFDADMLAVLISPAPRLTSPGAHAARERIAQHMAGYFADGRDQGCGAVMRARFAAYRRHGYTTAGLARNEISFFAATLANASITPFWMLARALADRQLREALVRELQPAVAREGGVATVEVAATRSPARCPLLHSFFRETMRLTQLVSGLRLVVADTALAGGRYLLPKGSFLAIETSVMHLRESIWGPDAAEFNPYRFCPGAGGAGGAATKGGVSGSAWRAFGGGDVLCPGRNLARDEIFGLVVPILMGFDVVDPHGGGPIATPAPRQDRMPTTVLKPSQKVPVKISRKLGWEDVQWRFRL